MLSMGYQMLSMSHLVSLFGLTDDHMWANYVPFIPLTGSFCAFPSFQSVVGAFGYTSRQLVRIEIALSAPLSSQDQLASLNRVVLSLS